VGLSPAIAAEVAALPDSFPRDPADRIIVATSRILGATLLTKDRAILEADIVPVLE
jgi:PIN domain nuclease of toxin-antitoxin system